MSSQLPAELGFSMPAEWCFHEQTWMAWPCRVSQWGGRIIEAKFAYARVAREIASFEPVTMLANARDIAEAERLCGPTVNVVLQPLDDSWMRDIGPTFLLDRDGRLGGAHWRFNAWGSKHPDYHLDAAVGGAVIQRTGARLFQAGFVLEGGSIHTDGEGTLLTSEQCLLNPNRNPDLSRSEIEALLKGWLAVEKIVWLAHGLQDDDTDGHIDNLACFVSPGVVMALSSNDPSDSNYPVLQDNLKRLRAARDAKGRALEVIEIGQPAARFHGDGPAASARMALSYINFYIANGAVIMPSFDDAADGPAKAAVERAFPDRHVVAIPALDILRGGGGIHCITQQQPKATALI
jgi:agmatine deiminase